MNKPFVAIVGRQNVGKSTLLNRLAGKPIAIVQDLPGTTRDRIFADVSWRDKEFLLIDTGGIEIQPDSSMGKAVNQQVDIAVAEADIVLFLTDAREGLLATDYEIAKKLRSVNKPMILVVNKVDNMALESMTAEFYKLGLGDPMPVSAYHGTGTAELLDKITSVLPKAEAEPPKTNSIRIAIVGRPNVGKSMLLNALLGEERAITSEQPGTTRDATDTEFDFRGQSVILIDTAGIRQRGKVGTGIERYSVIRALRAIERADIGLLVMDATELLTAQDMHVAGYIQQAYKGVVLVVNKWDLVTEGSTEECASYIRSELKFMPYAPVLCVSALHKRGTDKIMAQACQVYEERHKRLSDTDFNHIVQEAVQAHILPRKGGKQLKIYNATQTNINPPTFTFSVNDTAMIHFSYRRYLENKIRQVFGFNGTPIRLVFKSRGE